MNNLRANENESMYLTDLVILKCIKERLRELALDKDFLKMRKYIQHGTTNCVLHSIAVTHYSLIFASRLHIKIDYKKLVYGALLHDYFLYDWHDKDKSHKWHGFRHPKFALNNALKKWDLTDVEQDIIKCHMFPLTFFSVPKYKESLIVCLVDKMCATYEIFVKKNPYKTIKRLYNIDKYIK